MANIIKFLKKLSRSLFTKTKKIAQLPQGEEYDNWLGV
ncbi:MAG: hypothetical protein RLZZ546_2272 [Bacteroidota bacterium]|jgi:hypothetical protein